MNFDKWLEAVQQPAFWDGAAGRGIRTWVQAFLGILLGGGLLQSALAGSLTITPAVFVALPWATAAISASVATMVSVAMALTNPRFIAGTPEVDPEQVGAPLPHGSLGPDPLTPPDETRNEEAVFIDLERTVYADEDEDYFYTPKRSA